MLERNVHIYTDFVRAETCRVWSFWSMSCFYGSCCINIEIFYYLQSRHFSLNKDQSSSASVDTYNVSSDYSEHHINTFFLASGAPQVIAENKRLSGACWTGSVSYLSPGTDGKQCTFLCADQSGCSDTHYETHSHGEGKRTFHLSCR
jgi:hypothetical protein